MGYFDTGIKTKLIERGLLYKKMLVSTEGLSINLFSKRGSSTGTFEKRIFAEKAEEKIKRPTENKEPPKKIEIVSSIKEELLKFVDFPCMDTILNAINTNIKCGMLNQSIEIKNFPDSIPNYFLEMYQTAVFLKQGQFYSALAHIQHRIFSKEIIVGNSESRDEDELKLIISDLCYCLVAFTMASKEKNITLDMREIPTYISDALSKGDGISIWETFSKLSISFGGKNSEEQIFSNSNYLKGKASPFIWISILLQISSSAIAVKLLCRNTVRIIDKDLVLIAITILNNQINVGISLGSLPMTNDFIAFLNTTISEIVNVYPQYLINKIKNQGKFEEDAFLSAAIESSSKITGGLICFVALPFLIGHCKGMLKNSFAGPQLIKNLDLKNDNESIWVCSFISNMTQKFLNCSVNASRKVLSILFKSQSENTLFNCLIQELTQILAACKKNKIIEINPESHEKFISVTEILPAKVAEALQKEIMKYFIDIWELCLLIGIEGYKEKKDTNSKIRLASCLFRFSRMTISEQKELQFIQIGLALLKSLHFKELKSNIPSDVEALRDLGNAIEIYSAKWEDIVKEDKDIVLNNIKAVILLKF